MRANSFNSLICEQGVLPLRNALSSSIQMADMSWYQDLESGISRRMAEGDILRVCAAFLMGFGQKRIPEETGKALWRRSLAC